jgi:hypothetical protein
MPYASAGHNPARCCDFAGARHDGKALREHQSQVELRFSALRHFEVLKISSRLRFFEVFAGAIGSLRP